MFMADGGFKDRLGMYGAHTCSYAKTKTKKHTRTHALKHTNTYIHTPSQNAHICEQKQGYTHNTHTHILTYQYIRTHAHTHVHSGLPQCVRQDILWCCNYIRYRSPELSAPIVICPDFLLFVFSIYHYIFNFVKLCDQSSSPILSVFYSHPLITLSIQFFFNFILRFIFSSFPACHDNCLTSLIQFTPTPLLSMSFHLLTLLCFA